MEEFELRFKVDNRDKLIRKLSSLNFKRKNSINMADLIFPLQKIEEIKPGGSLMRIRLTSNDKPKLETKTMINIDRWDEHSLEIKDTQTMFKILSKVTPLDIVISKKRETWLLGDVIVTLDEVKYLGSFIEIEGPEEKVLKIAEKLDFEIQNKEKPYGWLLHKLRDKGKIIDYEKEALDSLKEFTP